MNRAEVLTEIVRVRDDIWGLHPRELSLAAARPMLLRLAEESLRVTGATPMPIFDPHATKELTALCLMLLETGS